MKRILLVLGLLSVIAVGVIAAEGDPAPQERGQRGDRQARFNQQGGPQGRDFTEMRRMMQERIMETVKERLAAGDEEWTVIQPRLSSVMEIQQSNMGSRFSAFMPRNRRPMGEDQAENQTAVQKASSDLETVLEKEKPSVEEVKAKLTALRAAREKEKQKLLAAQQKLKEVLTVTQEAQLVAMGILE
ncbi:MAG: hypothetical protein AB7F23_06035 [Phycisphaerae bacterium]